MDVTAYRGPECSTDHFLVRADIILGYRRRSKRTDGTNTNESVEGVRYNIQSVKQDSVKFMYQLCVANKLSECEGDVEDMYNNVKESIHSAVMEALGEKDMNYMRQPDWWTRELEGSQNEKGVV